MKIVGRCLLLRLGAELLQRQDANVAVALRAESIHLDPLTWIAWGIWCI